MDKDKAKPTTMSKVNASAPKTAGAKLAFGKPSPNSKPPGSKPTGTNPKVQGPRKDLKLTVRNPAQLGNAFLRFRTGSNLTQGQVGQKAGVKQTVVSLTEKGVQGTRLETVFKLIAALDLEIVIQKRTKTEWP